MDHHFLNTHDKIILRDLAKRVAEIASLPIMDTRRDLWFRHNRLERVRPMILIFPEGSWSELLPESILQCQNLQARKFEWELRSRIYCYENFRDDTVIEKTWIVNRRIIDSGWGIQPRHIDRTTPTGSWKFDPVIKEPSHLKLLKFPEVTYDPIGTESDLIQAQELFNDILDVKLKGVRHISFHLMQLYTDLRGLEEAFQDMIERPQMVHDAMTFLEEGHRHLVQQYIDLNLLSLNNDQTYHSSGGVGYSTELPKPDFDEQHVRPCDMWSSAESQELHVVSPAMHYEFALQYEKRLLKPFGLNGYGCCEDLTKKLDFVFTIPNIRRISISPFANVDKCAERLGSKYIFSWKPQPTHLVGDFDANRIRQYIQHTLDVTHNCVIEVILKDTHTCENHPERFTQWSEIAYQLAQEY